MTNIILAIEGPSVDVELIKFACYVAELTGAELTATLIKDSLPIITFTGGAEELSYSETNAYNDFRTESEDESIVERNLEICREECVKKGIHMKVSRNTYDELITESRFTDMIIADPKFSTIEGVPSKKTRTMLKLTECPVLLAPQHHVEIKELIHCYDGSAASVFAIKFFTYLFPSLLDLRCILLQVEKDPKREEDNRDEMQKWVKGHYSQAGFNVVQGNVEEELYSFLKTRPGSLITMGSYGRSAVSLLLKESRANTLIKKLDNPIFISHI